MKNTYIKSPLNYVGGKYKLLPQIIPLFPSGIDTFIDLFGGGGNVCANVEANHIVYNDINPKIVELLSYFASNNVPTLLAEIDAIIQKYELSKTNSEGFMKLRSDYNSSQERSCMQLYMLICHAFNYQIRFNSKGEYNMPFGKDRSCFNDTLRKNFIHFVVQLNTSDIKFVSKSFTDLKLNNLKPNDFVYCDPPYYNSVAAYNENGGWTGADEKTLLEMLDQLTVLNIRWALSNNLKYDNPLLEEWRQKYNTHYLNCDYSNCNYQKLDRSKDVEVLITNY